MGEMLSLEMIKRAVQGRASAFRCSSVLQPVGGQGEKVFPPTYEGGQYASEERLVDGHRVPCVLLDSVQSQANRFELSLLHEVRKRAVALPLITVDFSTEGEDLNAIGTITSLEAPHRISDAILRDSHSEGVPFRDTPAGKSFTDATVRNASSLFGWCPTALILGIWDSTGPKGGLGAKFARVLVSEIVGFDAVYGVKTSSRIDPLQIQKSAGPVFESAASSSSWTLNPEEAAKEGKTGKLKPFGKDGAPSIINHGNIAPSIASVAGGVTIAYAKHFTTLSLAGLRRLRFPIDGREDEGVNDTARVVLAALALYGSALTREGGYDLRSRCTLVPETPAEWELIGSTLSDITKVAFDSELALSVLKEAIAASCETELKWHDEGLVLRPQEKFIQLIRKNLQVASEVTIE